MKDIKMHKCTICKKDLPDSDFYQPDLKRYHYQCKGCSRKKNSQYKEEVRDLPNVDFNRVWGGYKILVFNYARETEFKYHIIGTDGYLIQTNDINLFKNALKEIL